MAVVGIGDSGGGSIGSGSVYVVLVAAINVVAVALLVVKMVVGMGGGHGRLMCQAMFLVVMAGQQYTSGGELL